MAFIGCFANAPAAAGTDCPGRTPSRASDRSLEEQAMTGEVFDCSGRRRVPPPKLLLAAPRTRAAQMVDRGHAAVFAPSLERASSMAWCTMTIVGMGHGSKCAPGTRCVARKPSGSPRTMQDLRCGIVQAHGCGRRRHWPQRAADDHAGSVRAAAAIVRPAVRSACLDGERPHRRRCAAARNAPVRKLCRPGALKRVLRENGNPTPAPACG